MLTLDADEYFRLPPWIKDPFDEWLTAEALIEERIWKITVGEGFVVAERYREDDPCRWTSETVRFTVSAPPPLAAFEKPPIG